VNEKKSQDPEVIHLSSRMGRGFFEFEYKKLRESIRNLSKHGVLKPLGHCRNAASKDRESYENLKIRKKD